MKKFFATVLTAVMVFGFSPMGERIYAQEPSGEITISCYDSMTYKTFLDNAARAFEEKYPGTKVNVNTFSAMPEIRTSSSGGSGMMTMAVQLMSDIDDPKAKNDYLTQINTDMISGGGADLYAADIIPYYKYADNGMLVDLREYMDNDSDFNYDDYQGNIFDATMYNGGQYVLPLDYTFNCLTYDRTLMNQEAQDQLTFGQYTYDQLVELGLDSFLSQYDADAENPLKIFNLYAGEGGMLGGNSLFGSLLDANYNIFVDVDNKKANFNDGRFANILKLVKEYEEKGYLNVPIDMAEMMQSGFQRGDDRNIMRQFTSQSYLYKLTSQMMLLQSLNADTSTTGRRSMQYAGGSMITENDEIIGMVSNENGESAFDVSQIYAMNANSKNKDTAWEFLKFLLGEEMQSSASIRNIPINKSAMERKVKLQLTGDLFAPGSVRMAAGSAPQGEGQQGSTPQGEEPQAAGEGGLNIENLSDITIEDLMGGSYYDMEIVELTAEQEEIYNLYMDYMSKYSSLLNSYMVHDTTVDEMIDTEIANFFSGSRTAEEVASALQSKINMYLQE